MQPSEKKIEQEEKKKPAEEVQERAQQTLFEAPPSSPVQPAPSKAEKHKKAEVFPLPKANESDFLESLLGYFSQNSIAVLEQEVIRKGKEIDFVVEISSVVGKLRYYCKAKAKKRINEGDFSTAFVQGQLRKLPVLFLGPGEPTKRTKEMMGKEFQHIVFKQL